MIPTPLTASVIAPAAFGGNEAAAAAPFSPAALLHLAILGSAARGAREFDALLDDVASMAGTFWRPDEEVVLAGLKGLVDDGAVRIGTAEHSVHVVAVRLTVRGIARFDALMARDIGDVPEPLFHAAMMVKVALLEALPAERRWRQIAVLLNRLNADLTALRRRDGRARPGTAARRFEQVRLESEIAWLGTLAGMTGPAGAMARGETLSG